MVLSPLAAAKDGAPGFCGTARKVRGFLPFDSLCSLRVGTTSLEGARRRYLALAVILKMAWALELSKLRSRGRLPSFSGMWRRVMNS